jgi:hypothetical protein
MTSQVPTISQTSPLGSIVRVVRPYLTGRRGLLSFAAIALAAGAAFNWSWLVAAGIAPLIVTALPCVAMCALGLCANKMMGKSCANEGTTAKPNDPSIGEPPSNARATGGEGGNIA